VLQKKWDPESRQYVVVFDLPSGLDVDEVAVVGDFNDWSADRDVMERTSDGRHELALRFEPGARVRFRYRIDGDRWENDWNADEYVANEFGGEDSLLVVPEAPPAVEPAAGTAKKAAKRKAAPAKKTAKKKAPAKKKAAAKKKAVKKKAAAKKGAAKTAAATERPDGGAGTA
jgi:hypothetical protein